MPESGDKVMMFECSVGQELAAHSESFDQARLNSSIHQVHRDEGVVQKHNYLSSQQNYF